MPAFSEELAGGAAAAAGPTYDGPEFTILRQKVDLDVDFAGRSIKGSTELTVEPLVKELKQIRLHCRQSKITSVQVDGLVAKWEYDDPYRRARMPETSDVRQHDMLKSRLERSLRPAPEAELTLNFPAKFKIQALSTDNTQASSGTGAAPQRDNSVLDGHTPGSGPSFATVKLFIEFEVENFRDGIHWIGHEEGDRRYPYMYTQAKPWAGNSSCIFPCVDDATSRCSWDISIRCARTLAHAFARPDRVLLQNGDHVTGVNETTDVQNGTSETPADKYMIDLSEEEAAMELAVVCIGEQLDDVVDTEDESRHIVSFSLTQTVAARHVGFAIGPFEHVDLSSNRESEQEERLGQSAMRISGYCLPGKSKDLANTCFPMSLAMDDMGIKYGSFPFGSYQMVFVDDFSYNTVAVAGLSFCNVNLLFPKEVIEPIHRNTKILIRTLANQWSGVNVIAKDAADAWVVAGVAGFMTDVYLKELCGNNEFRWQQKQAAEKVYELDVDRPSIRQLGELLHFDQSIRDFVDIKSALVLFILDRRLMKASGSTGVQRIINKLFLNSRTGALHNGELSTADFQRTCERLGHNKLEMFFRQWVFGSGCPIFFVTQRFNKKKLVVEMTIVQKQLERITKPAFEPSNFMREIKEHVGEVWAPETNPVFTGPMTIRIHEADGTPYEHIVEIKDATTRLEIPYNTKYKRLKRSRKQRERQMADGNANEGADDTLLYCLGGILDSEEEKRDWNLMEWTKEDEEKMGQEHYEWIRMDADFEWIGKIHLVMPLYMYISQLQQDRDIVAQYESMRYLLGSNPHHVNLTILVRTLMDAKYFWGIREMAAEGLAICAKDRLVDIGQFHLMKAFQEMFCMPGENMPRPNDFSDRKNFIMQCAIPRAMAKLRDGEGKVPMTTRNFFIDQLRFNDNSSNYMDDGESVYSDNHYVATLLNCLADALIASHREKQSTYTFSFGDDDPMEDEANPDSDFEVIAIAQIERHRRIDEWESSYQNLYSVTALECLQRLTKVGIVSDKTQEVMKYVRSGNADNVRLAAWRCLSEVGVLRKMNAMRYLLHCFSVDASPSFRDGLLAIFGEALGHIALGDPEPKQAAPEPTTDGLVLEQEASNEARKLAAQRKTTPEGALVALTHSLQNEHAFADALWEAATLPDLSLDEIAALCDIAALVYEPVQSLTLRLRYPRMWRCQNLGQGKVKFSAYGPYRTAPRKVLSIEDYTRIQDNGLRYTGAIAPGAPKEEKAKEPEIETLQPAAQPTQEELLAQIAAAKRQLSEVQQSGMPPPAVIPSTERTGLKISLGQKRKQSVDLGGQAASPKVPKLSRQQSPASLSITAAPAKKASPARRSSTPGSKAGKPKKSKIVKLRFGRSIARAKEILESPTNGTTRTTTLTQSTSPFTPQPSAISPPFNSINYFSGNNVFATSPASTMPLGNFRSYDPLPPEPAAVEETNGTHVAEDVKDEEMNDASSPDLDDVPLAQIAKNTPAVERRSEEPVQEAPAAPPPKRVPTLKLGVRKPSGLE